MGDIQLSDEDLGKHPWHADSDQQALEKLGASQEGLEHAEAERRRERFGPNDLPKREQAGLLAIILRQFKDPLIYILLIAGAVSLALGNFEDAGFIFVILVINTVIGTFQEYRAESSAQALQEMVKVQATVIRDGQRQTLDASELVPGDVVQLESGNSVPADLRLLEGNQLRLDESLLTGESAMVDKDADAELDADTPLGDRATLAHAGTSVADGRGRGVVIRTGKRTEVGKIAESLGGEAEPPPLVARLNRFTRRIAVAVLLAVVVLAVVQYLQGTDLNEIFFLAVALAVSAIPAGLPIAITVALSIATNRMAKRNVIVRQLPAVEGLGSCTLIASDKTGTLTANVLTARRLWLPDEGELAVSGEGHELQGEIGRDGDEPLADDTRARVRELALTGALCNEGELREADGELHPEGDTVDVALLVLGRKLDLQRGELTEQYPLIGEIPFESQRRYAATFHRGEDAAIARVKGAVEALLPMCEQADEEQVNRAQDALAEGGYRVLALAAGEVDRQRAEQSDPEALRGLRLLGLVGFIDPLREGVKEAVGNCHSAGVDVRMITGDHPATGFAIARQLGIEDDPEQVITGQRIGEIQDRNGALAEAIREPRVFARVEPTQKTALVEALQQAGHIVAVTGDGVNDAPALKAADIGVAMGRGGTDVARNASDLILTDDNFTSIVNGIEEGRIAYDNVRKVTWLLISTGVAEVALFFLALLTGLPLPLTPVQLLWLNVITNGVQDVALAFEKGEPGVLQRRPRPPDEPIFERLMIQQSLASGLWMGIVGYGLFYFLHQQQGMGEFEARNLLLLLMVLFENIHALNCRSERRSIFQIPLSANWLLIGAVVLAQGIHIAALYIPGLKGVLEVEPVSPQRWLYLLGLALSLALVVEMLKLFRRRRGSGRTADGSGSA